MPKDSREARAETIQMLLPWGTPLTEREDAFAGPGFWLAGGATLLVWTVLAFVLTTV